eukprot:4192572-Amphidinium_carterae.1
MSDAAVWNSCLEQMEGCSSHACVTARHIKRHRGVVQKFIGSGVGGPVWDTVWKRSTYNDNNGKSISDELMSEELCGHGARSVAPQEHIQDQLA